MQKKTRILSFIFVLLTILSLGLFGIVAPKVSAASGDPTKVVGQLGNEASTKSQTLNMNGFKYTLNADNKYIAANADAPLSETTLVFTPYIHIGTQAVSCDYSNVNLTSYSNVTKVIINFDDSSTILTKCKSLLNSFSLYVNGQDPIQFDELGQTKANKLYVCTYYQIDYMLQYLATNLISSEIDYVYYGSWLHDKHGTDIADDIESKSHGVMTNDNNHTIHFDIIERNELGIDYRLLEQYPGQATDEYSKTGIFGRYELPQHNGVGAKSKYDYGVDVVALWSNVETLVLEPEYAYFHFPESDCPDLRALVYLSDNAIVYPCHIENYYTMGYPYRMSFAGVDADNIFISTYARNGSSIYYQDFEAEFHTGLEHLIISADLENKYYGWDSVEGLQDQDVIFTEFNTPTETTETSADPVSTTNAVLDSALSIANVIYYSGDADEAIKVAYNALLWQNRELLDSNGYKIDFADGKIKVYTSNGNTLLSQQDLHLIKLESNIPFVYAGIEGQAYETLILDLDNNLYDYVTLYKLIQNLRFRSVNNFTASEFDSTVASEEEIATTEIDGDKKYSGILNLVNTEFDDVEYETLYVGGVKQAQSSQPDPNQGSQGGSQEPENPNQGSQGGTQTVTDPDRPTVETETVERQNGKIVACGLTFSQHFSVEEAIKIALPYMLWNEKELIADISAYDIIVKTYPDSHRLDIRVMDGDQVFAYVNAPYYQITSAKKFVYCEDAYLGALLVNNDSISVNALNLYQSILGEEDYDVFYYNFTGFKTNEKSQILTSPILKNLHVDKYFDVQLYLVNDNLDQLARKTYANLTMDSVRETSDVNNDLIKANYRIREVDSIYFPDFLNVEYFAELIKDIIITDKDGNTLVTKPIMSVYMDEGKAHLKINLTSIIYSQAINVYELDSSYKMGFVVFKDGTIAAITNYSYTSDLDNTALRTKLESFITSKLEVVTPNLAMPNNVHDYSLLKTYDGISYTGGNIVFVNSGSPYILASTPENPIRSTSDQTKGYHLYGSITYTDNYNEEYIINLVLDKILYKDGVKVTKDYTVEGKFINGMFKFIAYDKDGKVLVSQTTSAKKITSTVGPFIYLKQYDIECGTLLIEKGTNSSTLSKIVNYVLKTAHNAYDDQLILDSMDFTKEGVRNLSGTFQAKNFNYYEYKMDVNVIDFAKVAEANEDLVHGETQNQGTEQPNQGGNESGNNNQGSESGNSNQEQGGKAEEQPKTDENKETNKVDELVNDFKQKFEENKAFKAAMIAVGTVLGLLILAGFFLIFKKFFRWLGR